MAFTNIADLIVNLKEFGIFDFYLPFIIMFGIFYTLLGRTKIFGEPTDTTAKRVNLIVALGASLYLMYSPIGGAITISLSSFFASFFSQIFVVILSFVGLLMVLYVISFGMTGKELKENVGSSRIFKAVIIIAILIGVAIFFASGGSAFFPGLSLPNLQFPSSPTTVLSLPNLDISTSDLAIFFLVAVTGIIIYYVVTEGET